jgi:DNA polymerase epsilon subunit 1
VELEERSDIMTNGDVLVCAFDIETTKFPLQLPNSEYDRIFMISYMMDGEGYLISSREVVSEDIDDFEYTPKADFPGPFTVFNEPNEKALLKRFFKHMRERQPGVYVTFNGDSFDFPFVENRAKAHGLSMAREIGFECDDSGECHSRSLLHMDALAWVNRDSYLPQVRFVL